MRRCSTSTTALVSIAVHKPAFHITKVGGVALVVPDSIARKPPVQGLGAIPSLAAVEPYHLARRQSYSGKGIDVVGFILEGVALQRNSLGAMVHQGNPFPIWILVVGPWGVVAEVLDANRDLRRCPQTDLCLSSLLLGSKDLLAVAHIGWFGIDIGIAQANQFRIDKGVGNPHVG